MRIDTSSFFCFTLYMFLTLFCSVVDQINSVVLIILQQFVSRDESSPKTFRSHLSIIVRVAEWQITVSFILKHGLIPRSNCTLTWKVISCCSFAICSWKSQCVSIKPFNAWSRNLHFWKFVETAKKWQWNLGKKTNKTKQNWPLYSVKAKQMIEPRKRYMFKDPGTSDF